MFLFGGCIKRYGPIIGGWSLNALVVIEDSLSKSETLSCWMIEPSLPIIDKAICIRLFFGTCCLFFYDATLLAFLRPGTVVIWSLLTSSPLRQLCPTLGCKPILETRYADSVTITGKARETTRPDNDWISASKRVPAILDWLSIDFTCWYLLVFISVDSFNTLGADHRNPNGE